MTIARSSSRTACQVDVVEFWYLLKIVTPGTFRAMPAQVTPMYVPGVSASTTPIVVTVSSPGAGGGQ